MAQTLDARFQIKDDGSVVLRNISKELYKVKSNTKDASKAADAFGDTSVGATKRARKGHEELNNAQKQTNRTLKQTAKGYQEVTEEVNTYIDAQGRLRDEKGRFLPMGSAAGAGSNPLRSWTTDMMSFAAVGIAARKAWKGTMDAINLSAMQKVQETTLKKTKRFTTKRMSRTIL